MPNDSLTQSLFKAAKQGDTAELERLIQRGDLEEFLFVRADVRRGQRPFGLCEDVGGAVFAPHRLPKRTGSGAAKQSFRVRQLPFVGVHPTF